jgi:ribosomal protein S18 acetylase RimI-like enzyme
MPSDAQIRCARVEDHGPLQPVFEELDAFHREREPLLFRRAEADPRPPAFIERLLRDPESTLLVAEVSDGRIVGVANVKLQQVPDFPVLVPGRFAVTDNIAVLSSHRRQGVGRLLCLACEAWAAEHGAKWTELKVYEFNDAARAFYAAMGFDTALRTMRKPVTSRE